MNFPHILSIIKSESLGTGLNCVENFKDEFYS